MGIIRTKDDLVASYIAGERHSTGPSKRGLEEEDGTCSLKRNKETQMTVQENPHLNIPEEMLVFNMGQPLGMQARKPIKVKRQLSTCLLYTSPSPRD